MAVVATLSKGYDLDYIWKQVDRGPAKDAASYYIQASESGGEPPGRWWGPGAKALGFDHGQRVEREPYDLLFGERKAPDGTQLGRPPGNGRKAADLYAKLLAAEPHATAERRRELRIEATRQARQSPLFFDLTVSLSNPHRFAGRCVRCRLRCPGLSAGLGAVEPVVGDVVGEVADQAAVAHAERGGGELGVQVVDELGDPGLPACRWRGARGGEPAAQVGTVGGSVAGPGGAGYDHVRVHGGEPVAVVQAGLRGGPGGGIGGGGERPAGQGQGAVPGIDAGD
jgi:hypothetical protein